MAPLWMVAFAVCLVLPHDEAGATQAKKTVEEAIIDLLEVRPGMVAAEIGAGNGDLAVRLAGLVGPDGRVYANEIDPAMIELINKKKASGNVANLTVVLGQETDPVIPEQADRILLAWVYHHLSRPNEFMASLPKYLKSDGWLAVVAIDVRFATARSAEKDPCVSDPADVQAAIERAGFALRRVEHLEGYPELYMLTLKRAPMAQPQQLAPKDPRHHPAGAEPDRRHARVRSAEAGARRRRNDCQTQDDALTGRRREPRALVVNGTAVMDPAWRGSGLLRAPRHGASPQDVFAVGPKGRILHFDGRAVTPEHLGCWILYCRHHWLGRHEDALARTS